jgi:hypothetical protein
MPSMATEPTLVEDAMAIGDNDGCYVLHVECTIIYFYNII